MTYKVAEYLSLKFYFKNWKDLTETQQKCVIRRQSGTCLKRSFKIRVYLNQHRYVAWKVSKKVVSKLYPFSSTWKSGGTLCGRFRVLPIPKARTISLPQQQSTSSTASGHPQEVQGSWALGCSRVESSFGILEHKSDCFYVFNDFV